MTPSILYIACVVGAIGLYLIMRPHRKATRIVGTIAGAGAVAFIMVKVLEGLAADAAVPILEVVFGLAAIAGAARCRRRSTVFGTRINQSISDALVQSHSSQWIVSSRR